MIGQPKFEAGLTSEQKENPAGLEKKIENAIKSKDKETIIKTIRDIDREIVNLREEHIATSDSDLEKMVSEFLSALESGEDYAKMEEYYLGDGGETRLYISYNQAEDKVSVNVDRTGGGSNLTTDNWDAKK